MKIDLHVHSKYSRDNSAEPELIVEEALRKKLDGILITEHHSYTATEPWEIWINDRKKNKGLLIMRPQRFPQLPGMSSLWDSGMIPGTRIIFEQANILK